MASLVRPRQAVLLAFFLAFLCGSEAAAGPKTGPSVVGLRTEWYHRVGRDPSVRAWMHDLDHAGQLEMKRQALRVIDASLDTLPAHPLPRPVLEKGFGKVLKEVKVELSAVHAARYHPAAVGGKPTSVRVVSSAPSSLTTTTAPLASSAAGGPKRPPSSTMRSELFTAAQLRAMDSLTSDARRDLIEIIKVVEQESERKTAELNGRPHDQKLIQRKEGALVHRASLRLKADVLDSLNGVRLAASFLRGQSPAQRTAFLRSVVESTEAALQRDKAAFIAEAREMNVHSKPRVPAKPDDIPLRASEIFAAPAGNKAGSGGSGGGYAQNAHLLAAIARLEEFARIRTGDMAARAGELAPRAVRRYAVKRAVDTLAGLFRSDIDVARKAAAEAQPKLVGTDEAYQAKFARELVNRAHVRMQRDYAKVRSAAAERLGRLEGKGKGNEGIGGKARGGKGAPPHGKPGIPGVVEDDEEEEEEKEWGNGGDDDEEDDSDASEERPGKVIVLQAT